MLAAEVSPISVAYHLACTAELARATGAPDVALTAAEAAVRICEDIGFVDYWQTRGPLAYALFDLGRIDDADEQFRRLLAVAEGRLDDFDAGYARLGLARIARARGDLGSADQQCREALPRLWAQRAAPFTIDTLELLAQLNTTGNRAQTGARLLAAGDSARRAIGYPRRPADDDAVSRAGAELRQSLGSSEFEQATNEGRRLTLDGAVEYASSRTGPTATPLHRLG